MTTASDAPSGTRSEALGVRPAAPFIGRRGDLRRLDDLYGRGHRLVTLWGTAGIGKTRLAVEHARRAQRVTFCDVSEARSVDGVTVALAAALGLAFTSGPRGDLVAQVAHAIAARGPVLVVIDNFEQVTQWAAETIAVWVRGAPAACFLVTSRERLRLQDEVALELQPLSLPSLDSQGHGEAMELFLDRAAASGTPLATIGRDSADLVELVRCLEGLPLAIELAAANLGLLGVAGLLDRVRERASALGPGYRDAHRRQGTLHDALRWSWDLLSHEERLALAHCSVFRGGFTPSAAAATLRGRVETNPWTVLQSLRDKSLLRANTLAPHESPRLALFETIRQFASERLDELGGRDDAENRHATYFLNLWEQLEAHDDASGARSIAREQENFVAIVERALSDATGGAAAWTRAADALLAIGPQLAIGGPTAEHEGLLAAVLAAAPTGTDSRRARLLTASGRLLSLRGDASAAGARLREALDAAKACGDRRAEMEATTELGVLHHQQRDLSMARDLYERAIPLARREGSLAAEGRILANVAALLHDLRQFGAAREHYEDALTVLERAGDPRLRGITLTNLAVLEQEEGELTAALDHYHRAIELLRQAGDRRLEAICRGNAGMLELECGRLDDAERAFEVALGELRAIGDRRSEALAWVRSGICACLRGHLEPAREALDTADQLAGSVADPLSSGFAELARAFLDVAAAARAEGVEVPDEVNAHLDRARRRIAGAHEPRSPGGRSPAELSDDVRTALRILALITGRFHADVTAEPSADALVVSSTLAWCRPPRSDWIELGRFPVLRRLLGALVEQRRAAPGRGLSVDALVRAAWPGERIRADAAANRVYVAISKIRRFGLRDALLRQEDGYSLDPALRIERWDGPVEAIKTE